jgi:hypothetical protein
VAFAASVRGTEPASGWITLTAPGAASTTVTQGVPRFPREQLQLLAAVGFIVAVFSLAVAALMVRNREGRDVSTLERTLNCSSTAWSRSESQAQINN